MPQFVFSLLCPFPFSGLDLFNSFYYADCAFPAFFKVFINFLFEDVYQLLKIFFLVLSYRGIFKAYCGKVTGF